MEYVGGRLFVMDAGGSMTIVMFLYYCIAAFTAGMLIWNFIRQKDDKEQMILNIIVLIPLLLRLLRIR